MMVPLASISYWNDCPSKHVRVSPVDDNVVYGFWVRFPFCSSFKVHLLKKKVDFGVYFLILTVL